MVPSTLLHKILCKLTDRVLFSFAENIIGPNRSRTKHPGSQWNASFSGKKTRELFTDCVFVFRTSQMKRDKSQPRRRCGFSVRRVATHQQSILRTYSKNPASSYAKYLNYLAVMSEYFSMDFFDLPRVELMSPQENWKPSSRKVQVPTENKQKIKLPWEHVYRNFLCPARKRTS